jgi:hypothetical protein
MAPYTVPMSDYIGRNEAIAEIKAAFKKRGLKFSVTGGRGTAWGWIHIDLMPAEFKKLTDEQIKVRYAELYTAIGMDRCRQQSSEGIPASSDYYREYIDRANGIEPTVIGVPYWD